MNKDKEDERLMVDKKTRRLVVAISSPLNRLITLPDIASVLAFLPGGLLPRPHPRCTPWPSSAMASVFFTRAPSPPSHKPSFARRLVVASTKSCEESCAQILRLMTTIPSTILNVAFWGIVIEVAVQLVLRIVELLECSLSNSHAFLYYVPHLSKLFRMSFIRKRR
jgi:hypothetical protein